MTLGLHTGAYKPTSKPNDHPLYINTNSNHPPSIIKELPHNISKRISEISSSEEIFNEAAPYYNGVLKSNGYKENINYTPISDPERKRRIRKRKILWFNPPLQHERGNQHSKKLPTAVRQALSPRAQAAQDLQQEQYKSQLRMHPQRSQYHQQSQQKDPRKLT